MEEETGSKLGRDYRCSALVIICSIHAYNETIDALFMFNNINPSIIVKFADNVVLHLMPLMLLTMGERLRGIDHLLWLCYEYYTFMQHLLLVTISHYMYYQKINVFVFGILTDIKTDIWIFLVI
jgi:hypothetical protein